MKIWLDVLLLFLMVLAPFCPCYIFSGLFARYRRPVAGGVLALSKLLLTIRLRDYYLWEVANNGVYSDWERFYSYSPVIDGLLILSIAVGAVLTVVNLVVFIRRRRKDVPAALT